MQRHCGCISDCFSFCRSFTHIFLAVLCLSSSACQMSVLVVWGVTSAVFVEAVPSQVSHCACWIQTAVAKTFFRDRRYLVYNFLFCFSRILCTPALREGEGGDILFQQQHWANAILYCCIFKFYTKISIYIVQLEYILWKASTVLFLAKLQSIKHLKNQDTSSHCCFEYKNPIQV